MKEKIMGRCGVGSMCAALVMSYLPASVAVTSPKPDGAMIEISTAPRT